MAISTFQERPFDPSGTLDRSIGNRASIHQERIVDLSGTRGDERIAAASRVTRRPPALNLSNLSKQVLTGEKLFGGEENGERERSAPWLGQRTQNLGFNVEFWRKARLMNMIVKAPAAPKPLKISAGFAPKVGKPGRNWKSVVFQLFDGHFAGISYFTVKL